MDCFVFDAADETATAALGKALADALPDGAVVALCGTLGSGKTWLVQAIAEASGVPRQQVVSPTFVLIQQYQGRRPIYHLDAYRLRDRDEFEALGPEECFEAGGLTLIEWADRVEESLPADRVEVHIEVTGPQTRRFNITTIGGFYEDVIRRLRAWERAG
jgi:tRNA threonylcarbamoyladenosine biosynthesis protein TsaE